jgi:hypothetical protein
MICYKDKTFCREYKTCSNGEVCSRALTEEVTKDAVSAGLPVCQYADKPECYKGIHV